MNSFTRERIAHAMSASAAPCRRNPYLGLRRT
jgi:hypothetical protein